MRTASIFWLTGLSGSGKTTLALAAKKALVDAGFRVLVLDGDEVRARHPETLGFNEEDIKRNNEIVAAICENERAKFDVILVPIISPLRSSRRRARERLANEFYEIHCSASIDCLQKRDVKGLYAKARRGEISDLIGFRGGVTYEAPIDPDLTLNTCDEVPEHSAGMLVQFILKEQLYRSAESKMAKR